MERENIEPEEKSLPFLSASAGDPDAIAQVKEAGYTHEWNVFGNEHESPEASRFVKGSMVSEIIGHVGGETEEEALTEADKKYPGHRGVGEVGFWCLRPDKIDKSN